MAAEILSIRTYTTADGLAHNHINRILKDSRGFLWICTDDGLSRFDGYQFVNYTSASGLPHAHVNDMVETRSGEYWIATDGGVTRYYPEGPKRFITYTPPGPPDSLHINSVAEDRDGSILVGTSAGLYRLQRRAGANAEIEEVKFGAPAGPEDAMVNAIFAESEEALWLGAKTGLYRRGREGTWRRFSVAEGLPGEFINSFRKDPEGRLWVCTRGGVGRISGNPDTGGSILDVRLSVQDGLPHPDVRAIWFASDGRRWLSSVGGLVEWRPEATGAPRFRTYLRRDGLSDQSVYGFAEDLAGNLWIGSRQGGVMRLARQSFRTFSPADGLALSGDETIRETRDGEICVASLVDPRRVIHCFDGTGFARIVPRIPPDVMDLFPDSHVDALPDYLGAWWISGTHGLFHFPRVARANQLARATPTRLLPDRYTGRLFEDSRHDLWITTGTRDVVGLMRWERSSGRVYDYTSKLTLVTGPQPVGVTALAEDRDGHIWFGLGHSGPLVRWRSGRFEAPVPMVRGPVHALHVDRSNRLWIASGEIGLGRIDDPREEHPAVRSYTRADGLSSNEVLCLVEDESNRLYLGTARGVDWFDPTKGILAHYSAADGLVNGDIHEALHDRHGDLWFVSHFGVSRLSRIRTPALRPPAVRITAIRVMGTPLAISDLGETVAGPLEFSSNRNAVQIDFSAMEFHEPAQLRYQFRLEAAGQDWSEPASTTSVNYANLSSGQYRFVVRAINSEGLAGPQPASFRFTILSPLWRRWWVQVLATLTLAGAAFGGHRIRLNRLLALERERSRIAMDLHDDIGASLSRISVFSEVLKRRISDADGESQNMLADIAESSRTLVEAMSDIVWSVDPRREDLGDLVARIRAFASVVFEQKGIRWTLEAPPDSLTQKLSVEQRRETYLILKEAIHNVARHSHCRNAYLRIRVEDSIVRGEVEDDGCGLPAEDSPGMGLWSMRARAARLGGTFEITARPTGGAFGVLRIPIKAKRA